MTIHPVILTSFVQMSASLTPNWTNSWKRNSLTFGTKSVNQDDNRLENPIGHAEVLNP